MHREIQNWLNDFTKQYKEISSPTRIISSFIQMGVSDPNGKCDCENERALPENSPLKWLHENHKEYNRMVRDILATRPEMLPKLRRVLRDDQKVEVDRLGLGPEYGNIVLKSYGRELLDHFFCPNPTW